MGNQKNSLTVFVAGATGAVGIILCRLLSEKGYNIFGMTRKQEKSSLLASINVRPVILDVYDKEKLTKTLHKIQLEIIIHQLTDLPYGLPAEKMQEGLTNTVKIRDIGTGNLISAARGTSAKRFIAQSIAFMY